MKNVTIALDDETHRKARIRAAELGTSLSALVKAYLASLADDGTSPPSGVREMPMPYKAASSEPGGPPWLVDGKWVYTRDGKPRQPGSLRGRLKLNEGWEKWPPEVEEFFDELHSKPWNDEDFDPLP